MKSRLRIVAVAVLVTISGAPTQSPAQQQTGNTMPVTVENFIRAESDLYFNTVALKEGRFGKFGHHRELTPIDAQTVIRINRDKLYSSAVFDLDAGPVTVTLPNPGKRFMAMQIITEDVYSPPAFYAPGEQTLTRKELGARYVLVECGRCQSE